MTSSKYKAKNVPVFSYKTLIEIKKGLLNSLNDLEVSIDLGISKTVIKLYPDDFSFSINRTDILKFPDSFNEKSAICYAIYDKQIFPMKMFSKTTNFFYKLVPTSWRPILRISATQMHKLPFLDFLDSQKLRGLVLDGGTGLGYSAIIASQTANRVITIEWDPQVIEMSSFNPHSRKLFDSLNIQLINGDITQEVLKYDDNYFDTIIQDGGMPKSSGEFFSQSYCHELHRVLRRGGNLFFYLPRHGKSKGRDFGGEVINRLLISGFHLKKREIEGSFAILYKGN